MIIDDEKLDAMIIDYQTQHKKLIERPKRTQSFNHNEQLAKLEGQIFSLILVKSLASTEVNTIEQ